MVCRSVLSLSNSVSPTDNNFTIDSLWQLSHVHYQQHLMGLKFYLVLNPANPEIDFKFRDRCFKRRCGSLSQMGRTEENNRNSTTHSSS